MKATDKRPHGCMAAGGAITPDEKYEPPRWIASKAQALCEGTFQILPRYICEDTTDGQPSHRPGGPHPPTMRSSNELHTITCAEQAFGNSRKEGIHGGISGLDPALFISRRKKVNIPRVFDVDESEPVFRRQTDSPKVLKDSTPCGKRPALVENAKKKKSSGRSVTGR